MNRSLVMCLVLVGITVGVYLQVGGHEFINYDDTLYVTKNPRVQQGLTGGNILWAFGTTQASNWHPLTWLSHMLDVELFGLNPRGHHLMNVFIHSINTVLLFLLLSRATATPWQSLFVAALFALHPLHVESVAWVAERKDVLSCFFWLLTLLLYVRYVTRPGTARYLLVIASFAAGLMSKPMLVTLPLVMLLMDSWPLGRFKADASPLGLLKEKVPFFLLSLLSASVTLYAQKAGGAMKSIEVVPLAIRIENALVSYGTYIVKTVWPQDLALFYPFPLSLPLWQVLASCALLIAVSAGVVLLRRRHPYLLTGWLWFLVTLLPVVGIIQVGGQSMADRYTYIPLTGLFIMVAWAVPELLKGVRYRPIIVAAASCVVVAAFAVVTWRQAGYWRDNITLYERTLSVTENNYIIMNNYGIALADRGDVDGAVRAYREALRIWPRATAAQVNLGAALANQGRYEEAISHYNEALRINPDYAPARTNLSMTISNRGVAIAQAGRLEEAIGYFREAIRMDPQSLDAHFNLGITLARLDRVDEAAEEFRNVLKLQPGSAEARAWLQKLGR